jgi:hypothetical protein
LTLFTWHFELVQTWKRPYFGTLQIFFSEFLLIQCGLSFKIRHTWLKIDLKQFGASKKFQKSMETA